MNRNLLLSLFLLFAIPLFGQDLYDVHKVTEVKLELEVERWDQCLDSLKELGHDDRVIGKVTVDEVFYDSIGARYKGNSSYFNVRNSESSKLPFNIKANCVKEKQRFSEKYKSLKLSNVFRDPSFVREVLSYEIAGKYMPSPRANFAQLYVNDQYLGLYNNTESVDKDFLQTHFGFKKGTLIKCDPTWHAAEIEGCPKGDKASLMYLGEDSLCYYNLYEMKSNYGWNDLIQLTKILNQEFDRIEEILNVDQVLWMHAFNNVVVNLDSYTGRLCHNYYLYRDSFGIFHPILWDMNLSFGGFRFDGLGSALSNEKMQKLSPFIHYKNQNEKRPLITNLLKNDLYRKIYIAHLKTILEENFLNKEYLKKAELIQDTIETFVEQDSNKLYSFEGFRENIDSSSSIGKSKIIGIAQLMEARTEYLSNHPLIRKKAPSISEVKHIGKNEKNVITAKVDEAEKVYLAYRLKKYAPFQRIEMTDDGMKGDDILDDGIFSVNIEMGNGAEYYIIAEGKKNASLSPARASFEFYTIE
jgi:CotH kinase protein